MQKRRKDGQQGVNKKFDFRCQVCGGSRDSFKATRVPFLPNEPDNGYKG